jgi:hypothetical protein
MVVQTRGGAWAREVVAAVARAEARMQLRSKHQQLSSGP